MANRISSLFDKAAQWAARQCGRAHTFAIAVIVVLVWAVTGPLFQFSDTWQLVINTGTTIVTFLMVFLIQNTQNRDNAAIQVKLDELIRVGAGKNFFVGVEHLTDEEIERLRKMIEQRVKKGNNKEVGDIAVQVTRDAATRAAEEAS